jgi:hypothetical protein
MLVFIARYGYTVYGSATLQGVEPCWRIVPERILQGVSIDQERQNGFVSDSARTEKNSAIDLLSTL